MHHGDLELVNMKHRKQGRRWTRDILASQYHAARLHEVHVHMHKRRMAIIADKPFSLIRYHHFGAS